MFDYSLLHWTTFLTAAFLLNLSPGPDIAFILGQTAKGGRSAGFSAMLGIWVGAFMHVILAAVGLSAILATSAVAFSLVKWGGALYLIWLGLKALGSNGGGFMISGEGCSTASLAIFRQGVVVAALNPKVAIFFLAFLPQFVVEGAGPIAGQLFLHGCLVIVVAAFIEPPLIFAGDRLLKRIRNSERLGIWLDRSLGSLFIALGIRLALSER